MNILCDIFSEVLEMLKTFYNHRSQQEKNRLVADAEKIALSW